jgi:thiol-disulfide isomerase/thioredoxin
MSWREPEADRGRAPGPPLRLAAIAAVLAAGACLALWSGYEYGPRLLPGGAPGRSAAGPAGIPLALQVFGKPRPMPALAFTDADGRRLTLDDFRGRVVLLNIWATWCVPCRTEMPALERLEGKLGGKGFTVLPLSIDQAGVPAVERFYHRFGLKRLGIYVDPPAQVSSTLGIPGVPTSFLIDAEGREVARKIGPAAWDGPDMVALIRRYLPPAPGQRGGP